MNLKNELEQCAVALERGELAAERLRQLSASLDSGRQSLLYMQSWSTDIESQLMGYTLIVKGERAQGQENPDDWPYQSVAESVKDGWRIISFPNLALLLDEERTVGFGCEFILEKWELAA